ncbi:MAG: FAD binding domain-containing protein [Acidimicrobiales bacterium]
MKPAPFDYHQGRVDRATPSPSSLLPTARASCSPGAEPRAVAVDAPRPAHGPHRPQRARRSADGRGARRRPTHRSVRRHDPSCPPAAAIPSPDGGASGRGSGHTAIRTRGTLGGSIAHADPNAECPALALASDATIHTSGPGGTRRLAVDDFFEGMLETAVADDEVLTHVDLEVPHRWGFGELARRSGDFALVLACVSELSSGWRVVIGGVDSTPVRVTDAEQALAAGVDPVEVAAIVGSRLTAYDDLHAGVDYRIAMAAELTRRAAEQALAGLNDDDRSDA